MHFLWVSSNVVATCDQNHCFAYHRQSVRWPQNESLGKNSENKQFVKQTCCQYLCADTFASPAKTDDWMIPRSKAVKMDNSLRRTLVQAGGQTLHHRPPPLMCPYASSLYSPRPPSLHLNTRSVSPRVMEGARGPLAGSSFSWIVDNLIQFPMQHVAQITR